MSHKSCLAYTSLQRVYYKVAVQHWLAELQLRLDIKVKQILAVFVIAHTAQLANMLG